MTLKVGAVNTLVYKGDKVRGHCPASPAQRHQPHSTWLSFGGSSVAGTAMQMAHF